jgi:hypothetical protein
MSKPEITSPLERQSWRILFLLLSIAVIVLFSVHTAIMELARQAALRLDALMYTQNLMNSGFSIELGTWFLILWLVVFTILVVVHPRHKNSPFGLLLLQGFVYGMLLATLWVGRSQLFLQFEYTATPPEILFLHATIALPIYEINSSGIAFLVFFYMLFTWYKIIKYEPEL